MTTDFSNQIYSNHTTGRQYPVTQTQDLGTEAKTVKVNQNSTTAATVGCGLSILGDANAEVGFFKVDGAVNTQFDLKAPGAAAVVDINISNQQTSIAMNKVILTQKQTGATAAGTAVLFDDVAGGQLAYRGIDISGGGDVCITTSDNVLAANTNRYVFAEGASAKLSVQAGVAPIREWFSTSLGGPFGTLTSVVAVAVTNLNGTPSIANSSFIRFGDLLMVSARFEVVVGSAGPIAFKFTCAQFGAITFTGTAAAHGVASYDGVSGLVESINNELNIKIDGVGAASGTPSVTLNFVLHLP